MTERRTGEQPAELGQDVPPGDVPRVADKVDLGELLDTIVDELSMCTRYHRGLYPSRSIDQVIFVGGEARHTWLCQHIVKELGFTAQMGDPLARLDRDVKHATPGFSTRRSAAGWAVACGLCNAPTDL